MKSRDRKGGKEMLQSAGPQWVSVRRQEQQRVTVNAIPSPVLKGARNEEVRMKEWS